MRALLFVGAALLLAGCDDPLSPEERVLLERQKFAVEMVSWAPVADDKLALDLTVDVTGKSNLEVLTVEVHQVGPAEEALRVDLVTLDVAGMGFDGRRSSTASVPADPGVQAVAVLLPAVPEVARRADYPEFKGVP